MVELATAMTLAHLTQISQTRHSASAGQLIRNNCLKKVRTPSQPLPPCWVPNHVKDGDPLV